MAASIIDGKAIAESIRAELKEKVQMLRSKGIVPGLGAILVGDDPASQTYVRNKEKACAQLEIYSDVRRVPKETTQEQVLAMVEEFNQRPDIHGILVQLPLPDHIDEQAVIHAIRPDKDVDGFHPVNVGNLLIGATAFIPCTPHGIIELIQRTGVEIKGKRAVVV
ncbi:MAG: bifunctional methylenetetrahydrofolate dehydrogenase/methenyltetrahydrofolate cyclohydrolase, partial [Acetobacteraceae bacterium]|nr:bifunctional methylenetetrahydrofolate dehydrogenase/methenyltetrahydrofolate cyclohydrolase [Acetobacteraceae bacterium]